MSSDKELKITDSNGDGTFGEGDDISATQKVTLGDYLSELTQTGEKANHYTVSPGSSEWTYTNSDGSPVGMSQPETGADAVFIDDAHEDAKNYFNSISQGSHGRGKLDDGSYTRHGGDNLVTDIEGNTIIDKTAQTVGHTLLPEIEAGTKATEDTSNPVQQKISQVLQYNRWNQQPDNSKYIEDRALSHGMYTTQRTMGKEAFP